MAMDLKKIKGVGEKTASLFSKLGINDTEDLVRYLPRTYESYKAVVPVSEVTPGQVCAVRAEITTEPVIRRKGHLSWISFVITDESGSLKVFYFNAPYLLNSFKKGYIRIFRGRITDGNGYRSMEQPVTYKESEYLAITGKMVPVYRTTKGLSSNTIMKTVKTALMLRAEADVRGDYLPEEIRERTGVMERGKAIYSVHFPESEKELAESRKRLLFDDMFLFTLSVRLERGTGEKKACDAPFIRVADTDRLMEKLPYELTDDQKKVWREIEDDMSSGYVMNRLVQGDVGSGKTVVALLSVLMCTANGRQAVLMAPTEVLAEQHMRNISEMVKKYDLSIRPVLLTGSLSASEKKKCRELLESGEADLAIGTHALFQEKVKFKNLCLAVTDEQHRFGVRQRVSLADKGDSTHVLVMSATPIPRTLAMIIYGDLSISVIKQMPSGRKPIKNAVIGTEQEMTTFKMIYKKVKEGRQAYVICPMIEEDDSGLASAEGCYERLVKIMPGDARVGLLHGRMDGKSKKKTMEDFAAGNLDILVSTTVIEVGVNVPNATVMMIENAERFGLSQLHQLRGRIGRGDEQSFCVFLNTSGSAAAKERLAVMQSTNDGFEIAQRDMEMRGPGDIFGDRQSGEPGEIYEELLSDPELLSL
nr:ATP-dependent DNA helicase RecG [Lachnospiraceae bacterium]